MGELDLLKRAHELFGVPSSPPPSLSAGETRSRVDGLPAGSPEVARGAAERSFSGVRAAVGTDDAVVRAVERLVASHEAGQRSTRQVLDAALADRIPAADTPMGAREAARRRAARLRDQHRHVALSREQSRVLAGRIRRLRYLRMLLAERRGVNSSPPGGRGDGRAAILAGMRQALDIKGIGDPGARANWLRGADIVTGRESGHDNDAVNNWDSNARAGTPSKHAYQFIGSTFRAYHEPGTSLDQSNLVSQAAAFINYAMGHYGVRADGSNLAARIQQADPSRAPRGY